MAWRWCVGVRFNDKTTQVPGYHSKITRPMYMRLVDERLKRGGYLNEFAFVSASYS